MKHRIHALLLLAGPVLLAQDPAPLKSTPETAATPAPAAAPAPAAIPAPAPAASPLPKLDEGLLDPAWFGPGITFAKHEEVDFFWIKPGLDLSGRTIHMKPWEDPVMLRAKRDGKDNAEATRVTDSIPGILRGALTGALTGKAKASRTEGDLTLIGRVVDVNAGSKAAKWMVGLGAGAATATWDLKVLDTATGEVLLAVHHRVVSGTVMSTLDDKLVKWADKFSQFLAQRAVK
ncbi:MAG: DUF4410 domain-containing protein [Holophagaceae bacterium]|nr:DUF4410 domain-containing protein [Holophagaceae bacterium]